MFRVPGRLKCYSVFTYYSLQTNAGRPLSLSRSVLSRALLSLCVLRRRVRGRGEDEGGGCGGECEGRAAASRASHPSSPVPSERRHRVDPAMAVEEARSGPGGVRAPLRGGGGRPRWREGAGGKVRSWTRRSGQQPWRGSTPWRRTRRVAGLLHRHRIDPAMVVEEARSGPSGLGFRSRPTQVTSSAVFNTNCTRSYKSLSLILCLIQFVFFECVRFISASFCV